LATLPDQAQASAYFSIWFGEVPFSEDLKKAIINAGALTDQCAH